MSRETLGQFFTPAPVALHMARLALDASGAPAPRVLDPAAGEGAFLLAVHTLCQRKNRRDLAPLLDGVEVDPAVARRCRVNLSSRDSDPAPPVYRITTGDVLLEVDPEPADIVLLNPPYVGVRRLAGQGRAAWCRTLRERYTSAKGAFNLAAVMLERALQLLVPDGMLCAIVPSAVLENQASQTLRHLLIEHTTLLRIETFAHDRVFRGAGAYPSILLARHRPAPHAHHVEFADVALRAESVVADRVTTRAQADMRADSRAVVAASATTVRATPSLHPLADLGEVHCATAGFEAAHTARYLADGTPDNPPAGWPFVVTGNIDRYALDTARVRYQRRTYTHPVLDRTAVKPSKAALFDRRKLLVAGIGKHLEVAADLRGHAGGVNVYCISIQDEDRFWALLAYLNAAPVSQMLWERTGHRRLSGGYLPINAGQLRALPVIDDAELLALAALGRHMHGAPDDAATDREIDERVARALRAGGFVVAPADP